MRINALHEEVKHELIRTLNVIQGIDDAPSVKMSYYESRRFDLLPERKITLMTKFFRPSKSCTWSKP